MQDLEIYLNQNDNQLCELFRALALPVRIFIIRMIVQHDNSVTSEDFIDAPYSTDNINKQMQLLKQMGILKLRVRNRKSIYSVDEKLFTMLIEKANGFLESINIHFLQYQETGNSLPIKNAEEHIPDFGTYIKSQRLSFQLSQEEFAKRLYIERSVLSKIECGKATLNARKLKDLSKIIYEDLDEIKRIYYSDRIAELMLKGNLEPDILNIVKSKINA
ncbi:helix-turn-helix domain-containing protein [uncultured Mucilaginibacter sp.]|uniref:helix-turn-helix domain-containing protein n=1 Tax=uncultured Mucilaginibacter sp. TaxID=797541 RepID=UPI0025F414E3|nr:helix-turn-helix domain-containing protein [uncultured Mucilaginibacter sp.]